MPQQNQPEYTQTYHQNGQLRQCFYYLEGKFYGEYKDYHSNGQLAKIGSYYNEKPHGLWVKYHKNGTLKQKRYYHHGRAKGIFVLYHANGQLRKTGHCKNGCRQGTWYDYHDNGRLQSALYYQDGMIEDFCKHYHPNGQLASAGYMKRGHKTGIWEYFYDNGQLEKKVTALNEDVPIARYYRNGQLMTRISGGKKWLHYYKNGMLAAEYKNSHNSLQLKTYYDNGAIETIAEYTDYEWVVKQQFPPHYADLYHDESQIEKTAMALLKLMKMTYCAETYHDEYDDNMLLEEEDEWQQVDIILAVKKMKYRSHSNELYTYIDLHGIFETWYNADDIAREEGVEYQDNIFFYAPCK